MKAKACKEFFNSLTEKQLEQDVLFKSDEFSISGVAQGISVTDEDLFWDGEDDPSQFKTRNAFLEDGHEDEDIDQMEKTPAGAIMINLDEA